MKTIRVLNIKDWSGYFFIEMVNINDIVHECFLINDFKDCKDGSTIFNIAHLILFLTIYNVFLEKVEFIVINYFVK